MRRVDAGLAADRGIDLGQKRGRDLNEADAAAQNRRGKPGEIANDATAESNDRVAALDRSSEQSVADFGEFARSSWLPRPPEG